MTDSESGDSSGEDPEGSKVSAWDLLLSGSRVLGGGLFLCLVSREAEMKAQRGPHRPHSYLPHRRLSLDEWRPSTGLAARQDAESGMGRVWVAGSPDMLVSPFSFYSGLRPEGVLTCDPFLLYSLPSISGP